MQCFVNAALITYRTWEKGYGLAHSIAKDFHASANWAATSLLVVAMIFAHGGWYGLLPGRQRRAQARVAALPQALRIGHLRYWHQCLPDGAPEALFKCAYSIPLSSPPAYSAVVVIEFNEEGEESGPHLPGIIQHLSLLDCQNQYCKEHIWSDILAIEAELIVINVFAL
eukprot:3787850-Pyramimonas_sp.AAC.1